MKYPAHDIAVVLMFLIVILVPVFSGVYNFHANPSDYAEYESDLDWKSE